MLLVYVGAVVPEVRGSMELDERHRTIHLRTQIFDVLEKEWGSSPRTWSSASDADGDEVSCPPGKRSATPAPPGPSPPALLLPLVPAAPPPCYPFDAVLQP